MSTSTIVLLIYIFFLVPAMLVGFGFARRKLFRPHHKMVMTSITIINWILILIVMQASYRSFVAPALPAGLSDAVYLIPTIHLVTGGTAQLLATYLVIMMWFEKSLPKWFVIHKIKTPMRLTLSLWIITALLGLGIYIVWNAPVSAGDNLSPVSTEEAPLSTDEAPDGTSEPVTTPEGTPASSDVPVTTPEGTPAPANTDEAQPVTTPDSTEQASADVQVASNLQTRNISEQPVTTPDSTETATDSQQPVSTPDSVESAQPVTTPDSTETATDSQQPVSTPDDLEPVSTPDVDLEAIRALLANPQARRDWIIARWRSILGSLTPVSTPDDLEPVATIELEPVSTPDISPVATEDSDDSNDDNGGDDNGGNNNNNDDSGGDNNNNDNSGGDDNNNDDNGGGGDDNKDDKKDD